MPVVGPPPHARGSPAYQAIGHLVSRPTPACAGITRRGRLRTTCRPAHPRMRGDHDARLAYASILPGPPPHARGSRRREPGRKRVHGPTPACAGITRASPGKARSGSAHPRMRGDHVNPLTVRRPARGPPPHARGSLCRARERVAVRRPTPACAGITQCGTPTVPPERAHPRMRGDHLPRSLTPNGRAGPPPHARGSLLPDTWEPIVDRPTPACAGITTATTARSTVAWAHPRMRGDHVDIVPTASITGGPPPHARGSPRRQLQGVRLTRPTPACAGITSPPASSTRTRRAHPRMRGDHCLTSNVSACSFVGGHVILPTGGHVGPH